MATSETPIIGSANWPGFRPVKLSPEYAPNWFVVFTTPCHEKRVAQHFGLREIEFFLPLYHVTRRWNNGCTMNLEVPLFPSYIFARIDRQERVRVLEVPGVHSFVGNRREISAISDSYIASLREGIQLHKIEPHPYLVVGERVRIKNGPMTGLEGILIRKKNNFRVVLSPRPDYAKRRGRSRCRRFGSRPNRQPWAFGR